MLKKEIDIHIFYDPETKDMEVSNLIAGKKGLEGVLFRGVESVDTMMQALRAMVETLNEQ